MKVAVLGAGAGGASAVVDLGGKGQTLRLWNRSAATLEPYVARGGVVASGVLGNRTVRPECMTADLAEAVDGADGLLVCLPTPAHVPLAESLAAIGVNRLPVVLNPGHTGGALSFRNVFRRRGQPAPPVAEFSTLTYVARKSAPDTVFTSGVAGRVWVACLPGDEAARQFAQSLYPTAATARDVLATSLANVNMVLHPPGAILGVSWVESTGGDFTFYVQGLSTGVGRVMEALDAERLAVASAYGLALPGLFAEMQAIGTIEAGADAAAGLAAAVRGGKANSRIKAPDSLAHRYYVEDFFFGVRPFEELAKIAGVEVPVASALMKLAETMVDPCGKIEGRSAEVMGIDGCDRRQLLDLVRG